MLLHGVPYRAASIQRILDTQTMSNLVEHGVAEKRLEGDVMALIPGNKCFRNRRQDLVVLGQHGVLELQAAGALGQLDFLVIGQVDGNGLGAGVGVSGVINHVVGI